MKSRKKKVDENYGGTRFLSPGVPNLNAPPRLSIGERPGCSGLGIKSRRKKEPKVRFF